MKSEVDHYAPVDDRIYDRIRWRARRGLLENDLLLNRFFDAELMRLPHEDLQLLDELLRLSDNDLLDLLMGRVACEDTRLKPLVARIQAA
jgi:antitoxin CptB